MQGLSPIQDLEALETSVATGPGDWCRVWSLMEMQARLALETGAAAVDIRLQWLSYGKWVFISSSIHVECSPPISMSYLVGRCGYCVPTYLLYKVNGQLHLMCFYLKFDMLCRL